MKIRVIPADHGGCGNYRLRWPAQHLAQAGVDVEVTDRYPHALRRQDNGHDRLVDIIDVDGLDVIVFQRPLQRTISEAIPALQARGVAVVIDMDDDFHALPKAHPARTGTAGRDNPDANRFWLRRACTLADLVTVSTMPIADRYAPGHHHLIPNFVPGHYLDITRTPHDSVRVGWTGSTATHVHDLDVAGDGIQRALTATGATFHVVGTGIGVQRQLALTDEPAATGWVEIDDYPTAYAQFDTAIVPLELVPFNEAKSWLKGLEAAALGVPFIASPTGPYCDLAALGAGGLARTPDEWAAMVTLLVEHPDAREEIAGNGRTVAAGLTIEGNSWRTLEAWEHAASIRHQKRAAA